MPCGFCTILWNNLQSLYLWAMRLKCLQRHTQMRKVFQTGTRYWLSYLFHHFICKNCKKSQFCQYGLKKTKQYQQSNSQKWGLREVAHKPVAISLWLHPSYIQSVEGTCSCGGIMLWQSGLRFGSSEYKCIKFLVLAPQTAVTFYCLRITKS